MPADYDALSDGSELTGEDSGSDHHHEEDDDEVMASAPRTPSKKRRRIVRAVEDDDDEDEDEVADALDDDADQLEDDDEAEEDNDELDEDDDDYDAPSTSRTRPARTSGRRSATSSRAASTPKRTPRTSTRKAAESTPASTGAKKSLRVKLTRTPNASAPAAPESSPAASSRPSRAAVAAAPASRRAKDASKVKWKPQTRGKDSDLDDDPIRTPEDDELDGSDLDVSRAVTADPDASGSEESSSEPDEATAAEMAAIMGKTARQLAREGGVESEHMELPMFDPNRKKKLTENELALRRSETARKRKNQVEKKLEDDKVETINRLLKKQVGRSRNKLPRAGSAEDSDEEAEQAKRRGREEMSRKALKDMPAPFYRYIDRGDAKILAVPNGPPMVEEIWGHNYVQVNQALIEEIGEKPSEVPKHASDRQRSLEEKASQRFAQQRERWEEDQKLEHTWGQEGLYEYKLRSALGQSRREWIGDRRPPTPENDADREEQEEDPDVEADQEPDAAPEDSEQPDEPESQ